jgi:hypothetical protein
MAPENHHILSEHWEYPFSCTCSWTIFPLSAFDWLDEDAPSTNMLRIIFFLSLVLF